MAQESLNYQLLREVRAGNPGGVKKALREGADIDFISYNEDFALKLAAADDKNFNVAKLLLKEGAAIDLVNKEGESALITAYKNGCIKVVRLLLSSGANVHLQDNQGKTAFMYLCTYGTSEMSRITFVELAEQLLKHGANIDQQDGTGKSVLMLACEQGNSLAVDFLLRHKAQVNLQDITGESALMKVRWRDSSEIVEQLVKGGALVDMQDSEGTTAIMRACEWNHHKTMVILLNKGAQVDIQDNKGRTALMRVFENTYEQRETVQILLNNGAQVDMQDKEGRTALMRACEKGQSQTVQLMLNKGALVNIQDNEGRTALTRACGEGHKEVMEILLNNGAQVDLRDKEGKTALTRQFEEGHLETVRLLINCGAKFDMQVKEGNPTLQLVQSELFEAYDNEDAYAYDISSGQRYVSSLEEKMELLLKGGANVNFRDNEGTTALMKFCDRGYTKHVQLLLNYKANINLQDSEGETALMRCFQRNDAELLLKNGANVDLQDNKGRTALMKFCDQGYTAHVQLLLNYKAGVDQQDKEGKTALMRACEKGHDKIVQLLLDKGAQVDVQDNEGNPILLLVHSKLFQARANPYANISDELIQMESLENAIELLLKAGINVDAQNNEGKTALMKFCEQGNTKHVQLLLDYKADVNIQDNQGETALMKCHQSNNAELLLKSGAQVNLQDNKGRTALMKFCDRECHYTKNIQRIVNSKAYVNLQDNQGKTAFMMCAKGCCQLLLKSGAQVDLKDSEGQTALMKACKRGCTHTAQLLINGGANINLQDNEGKTALIIACQANRKEVTEVLLEARPKINVQDNKGKTALMFACQQKNEKVAELLFTFGAEVSLQDNEGKTAFLYASESGAEKCIQFLLRVGAGVDAKDSRGRTALITASGNGHTAVTDLLLERGAHIDSQDNEGFSALMTACQNGHIQTTSRLLDRDPDTFLKNSKGKTAFELALESSEADLLALFTKLRSKPSYPGMLFLEGTKRETISTDKKTIDLEDVGLSLSIPENALPSTDPPLQLEVQPCFSGSFVVPQDVELVGPAYIVSPSRKVAFQKEVLVKIWHHANLETEEDCEDMVFLSASTRPQFRGDTPVYIFKKMRVRGSFRPGEEQPVGQIALKHFCTLAVGKKRKREDDEPESQEAEQKRSKSNLYSARLYKAVEKKVVFCICLYHPQYIKNCNKVMAVQYGRSDKKIDLSECFNGVQITSSEVGISQSCAEGWTVVFKKQPASILKEEISTQEIFDISDLLEMDYPPKIEILIQSVPSSPDSGPLCLRVEGLNRESMFIIHPAELASNEAKQIDTAMIKSAMSELKEEIKASDQSSDFMSVSTLLHTAHEMLTMMEALEQLLQSSGSIHYLVDEMEKKSQQLKESAADILRYMKITCDMDVSVERANTLAVQMKMVYMSNMQHCNTPEWQCAVGLFVANAANLMKAIKDTLRASKLAQSIPNNTLVSSPTSMNCPSINNLSLFKYEDSEGMQLNFELIDQVSAEWRRMGLLVGLSMNNLEGISRDKPNTTERCQEVFSHWIQRNHTPYPPTWPGLYSLLRDARKITVAENLKEALNTCGIQF